MIFRPATLKEREEFYQKEFSVSKVKAWFKQNGLELPQLCAIDAGTDTKITKDKSWLGSLFYFPFSELEKQIKKYNPEDLYYDRNIYKNPGRILKTLKFNEWLTQELAFDIDTDNIKCNHNKENVCNSCLERTYKYALSMKKELNNLGFKKVDIIYSGKGFHVSVLDKKAAALTIPERDKYNHLFKNYPIDPWVSRGYIHLLRMPYSLHGVISRKVTPIKKNFNPEKTIPKFLFKPF